MPSSNRNIPSIQFKGPEAPAPSLFEVISLQELFQRVTPPTDHDPYQLHRLSFFAILINTGQPFDHKIDFSKTTIGTNELVVIAKGQTHCWDPKVNYEGSIILFTEDFVQQYLLPSTALGVLSLYGSFGPPRTYQFDGRLQRHFREMIEETQSPRGRYTQQALGALLTIFLLVLDRQPTAHTKTPRHSEVNSRFLQFKTLLEQHFTTSRDALFYANKMNITYKRLNEISHKTTGQTAKAFIDAHVVLEAKRLLVASPMQAQEIGFACGFEEPSNFVKFFKRQVGMTPKAFRENQKG